MKNILNLNLDELLKEFKELKLPSFRAKQVFSWLHQKLVFDFNQMSNLPIELRERLAKTYYIAIPSIKKISRSKDGTRKYLIELSDGNRIETVLLPAEDGRKTICLSSQVGCPLGCLFCATGKSGFKRNLEVSEILGQVYLIFKDNPTVTNLVFMGMGEPFLNYNNVMTAIKILISKEGLDFGQRKVSVSTCGIPEKIRDFAGEGLQVRLAVSLNTANDYLRSQIMPLNRKFSLNKVRQAIIYYIQTTGRRATLEYVMLNGINDSKADLEELIYFCKGLLININLIPYNTTGNKFKPSPDNFVDFFLSCLIREKINVNLRTRRGEDILAACGQLAAKQ